MNENTTTGPSPFEERIECALDTRFAQLARGWTEIAAPEILRKAVLNLVVAEAFPARSRARAFLDKLALDRGLLAGILAEPGRLLPGYLAPLKISAADFTAELERLSQEIAGGRGRELTDEEAAGVVAAGTAPFLDSNEIRQLMDCVRCSG